MNFVDEQSYFGGKNDTQAAKEAHVSLFILVERVVLTLIEILH